MIVIQTCKVENVTGEPFYKNYYATTGVKLAMQEIQRDRDNNDLRIYSPIRIYNVFDTDEE